MHQSIRIILFTFSALALQGCASYVNIPADYLKDPAINTIDLPPTPEVIAAAVEYALRDFPPAQRPFAIALPTPASQATWSTVLAGRPNAARFDDANPDRALYNVRSIRIRGHDARVDILLPESNDGRSLLEVHLKGSLSGWTVKSARRWSPRVLENRTQPRRNEHQDHALNPIRADHEFSPLNHDRSMTDSETYNMNAGVLVPIRILSERESRDRVRTESSMRQPIRIMAGKQSANQPPAESKVLQPIRTLPARHDRR